MYIECPKEYGRIDLTFGSVFNLQFAQKKDCGVLTGAFFAGCEPSNISYFCRIRAGCASSGAQICNAQTVHVNERD